MKVVSTAAVEAVHFDSEIAKGVAGRVIIGQADGASNFCMRRFDLAPGGHTPRHAHVWEHEIFFHAGEGEVLPDRGVGACRTWRRSFCPRERGTSNSQRGALAPDIRVPDSCRSS